MRLFAIVNAALWLLVVRGAIVNSRPPVLYLTYADYTVTLVDGDQRYTWSPSAQKFLASDCSVGSHVSRTVPLFGLLGAISIDHCEYLVSIKRRNTVGVLGQEDIWRVAEVEFHCLSQLQSSPPHSANQLQPYKDILESGFYYCETKTLATRTTGEHESDADFVANHRMLASARDYGLPDRWYAKTIFGSVSFAELVFGERTLRVVLLTRTNVQRYGARYYVRGADKRGNCANTVESEQILSCDETTASFVQVRGSIPLVWSEGRHIEMNLNEPDNKNAFLGHLEWVKKRYSIEHDLDDPSPQIHYLSLLEVAPTHRESGLAARYDKVCSNNGMTLLKYQFHRQLPKEASMKWQQSILKHVPVNQGIGFTLLRADKVIQRQRGVVRVNCLDCMDRTSAAQNALLSAHLLPMLIQVVGWEDLYGVVPAPLIYCINQQWMESADAISLHYSGSGAHQRDLYTYGYVTMMGRVDDGLKSFKRSMQSAFFDSAKQTAHDSIFPRHHRD